jgi:hypothetical protein
MRRRRSQQIWQTQPPEERRHFNSCHLQIISQPRDFDDVLCRQDSADQFTLRGGMYLVQVMLAGGFRHELPDTIVQTALGD